MMNATLLFNVQFLMFNGRHVYLRAVSGIYGRDGNVDAGFMPGS
jgi:hypothetical protein